MSAVYALKGAVADSKYRGAGHGIAAVVGNQVVDLVYLRDVLPELDEEDAAAVQAALADDRLAPKVREMSVLGELFIGMCSCYEFVVL
jgi:predicted ATPase